MCLFTKVINLCFPKIKQSKTKQHKKKVRELKEVKGELIAWMAQFILKYMYW